jgi:hypothetical protein
LPPWWPRPAGAKDTGSLLRPRLLEVAGEDGSGRLTLALAWLAAARPTLAAFVDPTAAPIHGTAPAPNPKSKIQNPKFSIPWPERFYPPAAAAAGIDLSRLVVVCPPADDPRAALDAVAVLLRSEAFDVILCPLPARARISTSFAGKLATLAARATTSLLLLTQPSLNSTSDWGAQRRHWSEELGGLRTSDYPGALGAFADYRVRLTARRWLWEDGELAGMKLRVTTERARAAAMAEVEDATGGAVEHELTFRLHRRVRYGASAADRLSLTTSTRLPPAAEEPAAEETGDTMVQPLALSGARLR